MPFLVGDLHPSWNRRRVALDGRRVIEVSLSLGTGDRRFAIARWEELHPLVQAAVREAERREAAERSAERDRSVPERLMPDAIRAIADQVLHSVLADHDRGYTESGHLNGPAQAVGKVLCTDGMGEREPEDLRAIERAFREGLYRDALQGRRLDRLDLSLTEGEVALPDEVAERLRVRWEMA